MKTSLKFIAFVLAAGFPVAAFADIAGAHLPSSLGAESMIGLFSLVSMGLLVTVDYSRRASSRAYAAAYLKATTETHRLAA